MKKGREYTPKQQAFLDALFGEAAQGNVRAAMDIAGYSSSTRPFEVTTALKDEIYEMTKEFLSSTAPFAAYAMRDVIENPAQIGNRERISAAKDVLDRGGHKPKEEVEISQESSLFILPKKDHG